MAAPPRRRLFDFWSPDLVPGRAVRAVDNPLEFSAPSGQRGQSAGETDVSPGQVRRVLRLPTDIANEKAEF